MSHFYDRQGEPLTLWEWVEKIEGDDGYRIVEFTELATDVRVSTVWLGVDFNVGGRGPPLFFETMVFGGPTDEEQHRYSSEEEARLGHSGVVEMVSLFLMLAAKDEEEPCL